MATVLLLIDLPRCSSGRRSRLHRWGFITLIKVLLLIYLPLRSSGHKLRLGNRAPVWYPKKTSVCVVIINTSCYLRLGSRDPITIFLFSSWVKVNHVISWLCSFCNMIKYFFNWNSRFWVYLWQIFSLQLQCISLLCILLFIYIAY